MDNDLPTAIYSSLVASVSCYIAMTDLSGVIMFLLTGILPGIILGKCYLKKKSLHQLITGPALCHVLSYVYLFFSYKKISGTNMFDDLTVILIDTTKNTLAQMAGQYPELADPVIVEKITKEITFIIKGLLNYIPAILIIASSLLSIILVVATKKTANSKGLGPIKSFSTIYASGGVSFLLFICLAAGYLIKNSYAVFFSNIMVILIAYYMLCGLSVADFFLREKIKAGWGRILIYAGAILVGSLFLPYIILPGMIFAGMLDVMFDFRKIRTVNIPH